MNKSLKKKIGSRNKSVSYKKSSTDKPKLFKSYLNPKLQLMVPQSFQIHESNKLDFQKSESSIIFRGDSGTYQDNSWSFSPQDTAYLVNPINYYLTSIYPNYDRFFWTGEHFIDIKNQVLKEVPQWLTDLLPEENLDIFLEIPSINNWFRTKLYLFDVASKSEILESRLKRLEFILENCYLQWKITRIPGLKIDNLECPVKILKTQKVLNIHQAYYEYKEALKNGASYLLLRPSLSTYVTGKSTHLLIWKPKIEIEDHK